MPSGCPDPEKLVQIGTAAVGDFTYDAISAHVEDCAHCRAVLQGFVDAGMGPAAVSMPTPASPDEFPRVPGFAISGFSGRARRASSTLARQDGIGRPVASSSSPADRPRTTGTAAAGARRAASKVRHPHVVTLYSFGDADRWSYLALEYVSGGTLKERLDGPLPPRVAVRLVEMIARAVEGSIAPGPCIST